MVASAIELLAAILWLSTGLAALGGSIFFFLIPAYGHWIVNKTGMDVESDLYESVVEAAEEAENTGGSIEIRIIHPENLATKKDD
jgi:hypothetical protein